MAERKRILLLSLVLCTKSLLEFKKEYIFLNTCIHLKIIEYYRQNLLLFYGSYYQFYHFSFSVY